MADLDVSLGSEIGIFTFIFFGIVTFLCIIYCLERVNDEYWKLDDD